jgi:hypothetical protein
MTAAHRTLEQEEINMTHVSNVETTTPKANAALIRNGYDTFARGDIQGAFA